MKILRVIEENARIKKYSNLIQGTHKIVFLCYSNIRYMHFRIIKNRHNKNPNIFALYIYLVYNVAFIPRFIVKAVQDDDYSFMNARPCNLGGRWYRRWRLLAATFRRGSWRERSSWRVDMTANGSLLRPRATIWYIGFIITLIF